MDVNQDPGAGNTLIDMETAQIMKRKAEDELRKGDVRTLRHPFSHSAVLDKRAPSLASSSPSSVADGALPSSSVEGSKVNITYPNGALRITRTPGRQNAGNCVNLPVLIHKDQLLSACVYAFYIADEELFRHLPLTQSSDTVPIYIGRDPNLDPMIHEACNQAGIAIKGKVTNKQLASVNSSLGELYRALYGKNFHAFYPWSSGSSHSKILLLVYPGFLRIVITSCNMMDIDTELGDNHWYIHDVPELPSGERVTPSSFEAQLLEHLQALKVPDAFVDSIRGVYDYSKVKVHLVTSVPGTHAGPRAEKHGLLRLRRVVKDLDVDLRRKMREGDLQLEVCTASVGNLSAKWLDGFHDCALGRKYLEVVDGHCDVPDLKLFYPTVQDVKSADEVAQQGAANIGCHTRPWNSAPADIKRIFHRYESKDAGRLFHQKMILAYNPRDSTAAPYYVYIGSANLSQSAWGALERDKKGNEATCDLKLVKTTNLECGVVVPGHLIKDLLEHGTPSWRDGIVPYVQTTNRYDLHKDKPWNDPRWVTGYEGDN
ncbi:hypothetical protein DL770_004461 [Monosporascus sp. CRB-9-2]|nr:hypothetical protein DL770_004461 [Monosporascus sp. CRB-9-2]